MNTKQTIQFVVLYRDAECLWKINPEVYKDTDTRDGALKKIYTMKWVSMVLIFMK
jgi:hypothetical protein